MEPEQEQEQDQDRDREQEREQEQEQEPNRFVFVIFVHAQTHRDHSGPARDAEHVRTPHSQNVLLLVDLLPDQHVCSTRSRHRADGTVVQHEQFRTAALTTSPKFFRSCWSHHPKGSLVCNETYGNWG
jgi:hypothetical protein